MYIYFSGLSELRCAHAHRGLIMVHPTLSGRGGRVGGRVMSGGGGRTRPRHVGRWRPNAAAPCRAVAGASCRAVAAAATPCQVALIGHGTFERFKGSKGSFATDPAQAWQCI